MTRRLAAGLLILPLAGGIGLIVYLLAGLSLRLALLLAITLGVASAAYTWRRMNAAGRSAARERIVVGLLAGLAGTVAYDGLRYLLVKGLHFRNWPFDVFKIFGQLLVGPGASASLLWWVGTAFHFGCGMGFGAAYSFLFRRPGIWTGLGWAAVLELFMITLYPGWLRLKALDELATTSVLGHAAYGAVLGWLTARYVKDRACAFL